MRNELCINGQTNATYVQSPRQTEEKLSRLWMPKLLVVLLNIKNDFLKVHQTRAFVPKVRENIPYFGLYLLEEYQIVPHTTIGVPKTSKKHPSLYFKM